MSTATTPQEALSERIRNMSESATIAMAQKARELKSQGKQVINLSVGEPDFSTPDYIKDAAKEAIDEGYTFYTPVSGYPELREQIAAKLRDENQLECGPENIVVSTGAKQSIANVLLSLVNPGEEVIIFSPYWVSYYEIIKLAGGKPVPVEGRLENDFVVKAEDVQNAITSNTKAILFSSPCNPSGAVFPKEDLKALADVVQSHPNLFVIADEIYEYINYGEPHFSIGSLEEVKEQVITVNGFSKGFAMTGWRVGYIAAPQWLAKACDKIQGQITSGTNAIAQRACITALSNREKLRESREFMREAYQRRRDLVINLLKDIPGIRANTPKGAFYIFPDVSEFIGKSHEGGTIQSATDLCLFLLNDAHVSTVTGDAFGAPNCIRISYAASDEDIKEALGRIRKSLEKLQ